MLRSTLFSRNLPTLRLALVALTATTLLASSATANAKPTKRVVKQAQSPTLGATILTTLKGHTLYSLSVEKHGRFICTGSCLSAWHPLTVAAGVKPTGPVALGTVERPEGKTQVTYKGRPLYTFSGDTGSGDLNGEGIEDVGTWHAATKPGTEADPVPPRTPEAQAPTYPAPESSGGQTPSTSPPKSEEPGYYPPHYRF